MGPPAIILSSGHSKRLGQPKSLVEINGKTLLSLAVDKLILAGCSPVGSRKQSNTIRIINEFQRRCSSCQQES